MPLSLRTPPAALPIELAMLKAELRIEGADEDVFLQTLIAAATRRVEFECGLALIDQSWRLLRDAWPRNGILTIPLHPVRTVTSLKVIKDGVALTPPVTQYDVDLSGRPARIRARPGFPQPDCGLNTVQVDIDAGFGPDPSAVPEDLRLAVCRLAAHWYEDRAGLEDCPHLPGAVRALLAPWRMPRLGA